MCGIVGFFDPSCQNKQEVLDQMGTLIAHRGPDSGGSFIDDCIAIGFRRLSIIDLEGGHQPIYSPCGRYLITFNGEIYNYQQLRKELEQQHGAVFSTQSDTEVILQAYLVFGEKTAEKLRGMFAFVIYDKQEKKLYGARDYFGIKPFYYAKMGDAFLYGSEIKSFLAHPSFQKKVNPQALKMYLIFQYNPLEETIFQGVFKLNPGTYFTYDGNEMVQTVYHEISYEINHTRSFEDTVQGIEDAVQESVRQHQISDVEVGSFLSAGVDSSYIASSVKPMKTYTVGFSVDGFDETKSAAELAQILNMQHEAKTITPDEFFDALPMVQYHSDEPHANLSAVPLYFLSKLAAKDLKVVLSGEGADEFFGGYESYFPDKTGAMYQAMVPAALRRKLGKWAKDKTFKGHNFLARNANSVEQGYLGQAFIMDNDEADAITAADYQTSLTYQQVTKPFYDKVKDADTLHKKMFIDLTIWLPHDIFLKADKMTMAHSLELRVPYMDKKVWGFARTISSAHCVDDTITKKAFRTAALRKIPSQWAKRKKLGFMVPFRVWIKQDQYYAKVKEMFEKDFAGQFFNQAMLLSWLEDHRNGKGLYQRKIYTVYSFLLWYEQYFILR